MHLKYLDGSEADDRLFDLQPDERRAYVAKCMGCSPDHPDGWPIGIIDRLIGVRRAEGQPAFYRALGQMLAG